MLSKYEQSGGDFIPDTPTRRALKDAHLTDSTATESLTIVWLPEIPYTRC
jgi:hypothetical protein